MKKTIGFLLLVLVIVFSSIALTATSSKDLVIYHWWTAGGEKEAIDTLFKDFIKANPGFKIVENPVAGGGGGIMRAQIKTMIMAGNPPDSFQITYGRGMISSFISVLQPVDKYLTNFKVPQELYEWGKVDGKMYGVPINLMQNNCLWYNKKLTDKLGIKMPIKSLDEFLNVCADVKKKGYIPLAIGAGMGQKFWLGTLFEAIFTSLPDVDPIILNDYYNGKLKPSKMPAFKRALEIFRTLLDKGYINSDYSAITWDQAADQMSSEKAVFYVMGDWAKGRFTSMGLKPNVDFGYQPFPGGNNVFIGHSDCFVLPKGVNKNIAIKWLKYLTTVKAENLFCPIKGATPPRIDAPTKGIYDDISLEILSNFRSKSVKKILSQFGAPPESYLDVFGTAFSKFFNKPEVNDTTLKDFDSAYDQVFGF